MRGGPRVGLDNAPASAYVVAVVLVLTLVYSVLQVGFVRPYLPADPAPNLARPPVAAGASVEAAAEWRQHYHADIGHGVRWDGDPGGWARAHAGMIVQVIVFTGAAVLLFLLRSNDITAALVVLALALSAVAGGGPLRGAENALPLIGPVFTLFAW